MTELVLISPNSLQVGGKIYTCASGRGGIKDDKVEGDGATPIGSFSLLKLYYRRDRLTIPACQLPHIEITADDGWCDEPTHLLYNQAVKLPFAASHEELWREDHVYDIVITLDHNTNPTLPFKGSAIFIHLARDNYEPTAGCIALALEDLLEIIPQLSTDSKLTVLS